MLYPSLPPSVSSSFPLMLLYLLVMCSAHHTLGIEFVGNQGNFTTLFFFLFLFPLLSLKAASYLWVYGGSSLFFFFFYYLFVIFFSLPISVILISELCCWITGSTVAVLNQN